LLGIRAMDGAHSRTLHRALEIIGSRERLAEAIEVPLDELDLYLAGHKALPQPAFITALDIVAGRKSAQ
jgi:hypothetical protein